MATLPSQSYDELLEPLKLHCIAKVNVNDPDVVYRRMLQSMRCEPDNITGSVIDS